MLSLEECRRLLPPSVQLDDEELEKIRQQVYALCAISYEALARLPIANIVLYRSATVSALVELSSSKATPKLRKECS